MYLRVQAKDADDLKDLLEKIFTISTVVINYGVLPCGEAEKDRLWWKWEKEYEVVSLSPITNDYKIFVVIKTSNIVILRFWNRYDDKIMGSLVSLLNARFKFCTAIVQEH